MANFTAPAASVGRRFSGFPIIVILVVCLVGGAAYFLFLKDQYFSGQNAGNQGRTAQVVQQVAAPTQNAQAQKEELPQAAAPATNTGRMTNQPTQQMADAPHAATAVANFENTPAQQLTKEAAGARIDYGLIGHDGLEKLNQGADGRIEIGRFSMATVPQMKAKIDAGLFKPGRTSDEQSLTLGQSTVFFSGGKEKKSGELIGFFTDLLPSRQTERGVEYKISIRRSLPEYSPAGDVKFSSDKFDETVVLAPGSGVAIGGLLPRKTIAEGEDDLYSGNVLKALLVDDFQKGDVEFVVLLYPHL